MRFALCARHSICVFVVMLRPDVGMATWLVGTAAEWLSSYYRTRRLESRACSLACPSSHLPK
jgi:hypothetical protein